MTPSEVFYEAACQLSNGESACGHHACCVIDEVSNCDNSVNAPYYIYKELMQISVYFTTDVDEAARDLEWDQRDFRTFMLLMAAEAVR